MSECYKADTLCVVMRVCVCTRRGLARKNCVVCFHALSDVLQYCAISDVIPYLLDPDLRPQRHTGGHKGVRQR